LKWKPFAFNHVRLSIPEAWDLMKFSGDSARGDLVMDDGERVVMDAQWAASGRHDAEALEQKLIRRQKGLEVRERLEIAENRIAFRVDADAGRMAFVLALEASLKRYVLLRLLRPPADLRPFARTLTQHLGEAQTDSEQPWSFFATEFRMSAGWRLASAALQVGCMKLVFEQERRRLTLWDLSLLDQVEKRGDTKTFATELVGREYVKRFVFAEEKVQPGEDPAEFTMPGHRRWRWLVDPRELFLGNRRIWLQGVANRAKNRFSILLFQYRRPNEIAWLGPLPQSLREPEGTLCLSA